MMPDPAANTTPNRPQSPINQHLPHVDRLLIHDLFNNRPRHRTCRARCRTDCHRADKRWIAGCTTGHNPPGNSSGNDCPS